MRSLSIAGGVDLVVPEAVVFCRRVTVIRVFRGRGMQEEGRATVTIPSVGYLGRHG